MEEKNSGESFYSFYMRKKGENTVVPQVTEETPTRGRKAKGIKGNEITFDAEGGSKTLIFKLEPENSSLMVRVTSDFVTYSVDGGELTINVKPNIFNNERRCVIKISNSYDISNFIAKTIIQKSAGN